MQRIDDATTERQHTASPTPTSFGDLPGWWLAGSPDEGMALLQEYKERKRRERKRRDVDELLAGIEQAGRDLPLYMVELRERGELCPTCGFPPGEPGYVRYDVPASDPRSGRLYPCPDCHGDHVIAGRLRESSQLTGWLLSAALENYKVCAGNREAYDAACEFAEDPRGWLTLWGSFGPGKTHLLAAIVNRCMDRGIGAVYFTMPDLLDAIRDSYGRGGYSSMMDRLFRVRVLAIDEVGHDKVNVDNRWVREKIYQIMDARYRRVNEVGTVLAMNVEPRLGEDDEVMGWLYSRMHDRNSRVVRVGGGDVRPIDFTARGK